MSKSSSELRVGVCDVGYTIMADKIRINFKLIQNERKENVILHLPVETTVVEVKEILAKKFEYKNVDLLFVGQIMLNEKQLKQYSLASSTTIYVLRNEESKKAHQIPTISFPYPYLPGMWMHHSAFNNSTSIISSLVHAVNTQQPVSNSTTKHNTQFYVYCKDYCDGIVKGKLRVRCNQCKGSEIRLLQEPENWFDVSTPKRCLCYREQCEKDNHAEFYFQCASKECSNINATPIKCVKDNLFQKDCCICFEKSSPLVNFACDDDHVLCIDCFTSYAREEILNRRLHYSEVTGYNVMCPAGCDNSQLNDPHIFYYLGKDEYKMYQEIAAESCVLRSMGGFICPNRSCGTGLFDDLRNAQTKFCKCSVCGYEFCGNCKEEYHGVTECSEVTVLSQAAGDLVGNYKRNVKTIHDTTKPCPCCRTPTEKNGGCMHLTCFNCKYEWCWICNCAWSTDCQSDHWFA